MAEGLFAPFSTIQMRGASGSAKAGTPAELLQLLSENNPVWNAAQSTFNFQINTQGVVAALFVDGTNDLITFNSDVSIESASSIGPDNADFVLVRDTSDGNKIRGVPVDDFINFGGDVDGPASATDNALARYDGTTGKIIQNSNGILTDGGDLTGITVDGRNIATDGTKLDGIEPLADVTDAASVEAAGAVMETDFGNSSLQTKNSLGAMANVVMGTEAVLVRQGAEIISLSIPNSTMLGRQASGSVKPMTKSQILNDLNVEDGADVTDTANVTSAGALMDSEVASLAAIKDVILSTGLTISANWETADETKLAGIEDNADVTDASNVDAAGAVMESDFANNSVRFKNSSGVMGNVVFATESIMFRQGGEIINTGTIPASTIFGRKSTGSIGAMSAAETRTILNVEDNADVTDTANVTAAGALMDSEVDVDIKTLALPANTTITTFGASLVDDADATAGRVTLGVVIGTDVMPELAVVSLAQAQDDTNTTEYSWTPQRVQQAAEATPHYIGAQIVANDSDVAAVDDLALIHIPFARKLVGVHAEVATAGTTGTLNVDVLRNGTSMLSTVITIDSGETGSDTAATPAVIDTSEDDTSVNDVITINVDSIPTTAPKGLTVTLTFENS